MRKRDIPVAGAAVVLALSLAGCSLDFLSTNPPAKHSAQANTPRSRIDTNPASTPPPPASTPPAVNGLTQAPAPKLCGAHGRLSGYSSGGVRLDPRLAAVGSGDVVIAAHCRGKGDALAVYTRGPRLIDTLRLPNAQVTSVRAQGGSVKVGYTTSGPRHTYATTYDATVTLSGGSPRLDPGPAQSIVYQRGNNPRFASGAPGVVNKPADARRDLGAAPADFKAFIVRRLAQLNKQNPGCPQNINVTTYSHGWASGGEAGCGGNAAIWGRVNGRWKAVQGSQDAVSCSQLHRLGVPADPLIAKTCFDPSAHKVVGYHG